MQGKLRNEPLSFEIRTECQCCRRRITFQMRHDLSYTLDEADCSPTFFMPIVDFTKLKAPSIIDHF